MKYRVGDKVRISNATGRRSRYNGKVVTIAGINPNGKTTYKSNITHYSVGDVYVFWEDELTPINTRKIVITSDGTETLARLYEGNKVVKSATAKCSPEDAFDFNIGAKLAFDRLIGEEKTSEKWRVVHRPARVGDHIRIKEECFTFNKNGDILKVAECHDNYISVKACDHPRNTGTEPNYLWNYCSFMYEVVESCTAEKKEEYYNGKVVCIHEGVGLTVGKVYEFKDGYLEDDVGSIRPAGGDPVKDLADAWAKLRFIALVE